MKKLVLSTTLSVLALAAVAQVPDPAFGFEGPRIVGGDFSLTWGDTKLFFGAGYEGIDVGRDGATGDPRPADNPKDGPFLADGVAKLKQTWPLAQADLWTTVGVVGHGDFGLGSRTPAFVADRDGGLFGFVQAGVTRDRMVVNSHQVRSGTFAEVLVEVGPPVLSVRGTDYIKAALSTAALVPLWDLDGPRQMFSGVLALRGNLRWIDGASVPLLLLEPTEVRGYQRLLDTKFRSVTTAELRVGLPSVWDEAGLVPVVIAFAEGGWYQGYANAPAGAASRSGWLASVGTGLGLTVLGLTTPTLSVALPLAEESALWWTFNFNLRF